jgi:GrpB-like predicted nucleotidyltransferase (UPF0157 family)
MQEMLGLAYGSVTLAPYNASWSSAYSAERARLAAALAAVRCRIEHVGSTAVPELRAKPIIDIAVGIAADTPIESMVAALQRIGYRYRGDAKEQGGQIFVLESSPGIRTHHLHVVALDDPQWREYLAFRDLLRHNADARRTYATEKQRLADRYRSDRQAYTAGKQEIIQTLLRNLAGEYAANIALEPPART